eukprot:8290003-Alexandrium_andersonii.AAC.1
MSIDRRGFLPRFRSTSRLHRRAGVSLALRPGTRRGRARAGCLRTPIRESPLRLSCPRRRRG